MTGSREGCDVSCSFTPVRACVSGDHCCPSDCDTREDNDCSSTCGNDTVEPNETCDGTGDKACPTSCDDKDPCTEDHQSGSAKNCSIVCTHVPVTCRKERSPNPVLPASAKASERR